MPRMCLFIREQHNTSLAGAFVLKNNIHVYVKQTTDRPDVITGKDTTINKQGYDCIDAYIHK